MTALQMKESILPTFFGPYSCMYTFKLSLPPLDTPNTHARARTLRNATPVNCTQINFRYPLLLSSLGLITAATVAHGGALLGFIHPRQQAKMTRPFLLKNILPVGVCHACTLAAGTR